MTDRRLSDQKPVRDTLFSGPPLLYTTFVTGPVKIKNHLSRVLQITGYFHNMIYPSPLGLVAHASVVAMVILITGHFHNMLYINTNSVSTQKY